MLRADKRCWRSHLTPSASRGAAARNRGRVLPAGYGSVPMVLPEPFGSASHASGDERRDTGATQIRAAGTPGASWNPRCFPTTLGTLARRPSGGGVGFAHYSIGCRPRSAPGLESGWLFVPPASTNLGRATPCLRRRFQRTGPYLHLYTYSPHFPVTYALKNARTLS